MSNQEPFIRNSSRQKERHAGDVPANEGGEVPLKEYEYSLPLDQADEQNLTTVPDNVREGFQHAPQTQEELAVAEEHRLKRLAEEKQKKRRRHLIVGGVAAAGVLTIVSTLTAARLFLNGVEKTVNDPTGPNQDPGVSGPAVAGENNSNANETEVGSVSLSAEQLEAFNSGDIEAQNAVINETILTPLHDQMSAYSSGESDSFDISGITSDHQIQEDILEGVRAHWPDFDEKREAGLQEVGFCNANVADPEAVGGPCEKRYSVMQIGKPMVLDGFRVEYEEGTFAPIPEDPNDKANTRPEFQTNTLTLSLDGNVLSIAKR